MNDTTSIDIGDNCVACGCNTAAGSGNWVNRVPAETDEATGYLCAECQTVTCDMCGNDTLEYEINDGRIVCGDCAAIADPDTEITFTISFRMSPAGTAEDITTLLANITAQVAEPIIFDADLNVVPLDIDVTDSSWRFTNRD